MNWQDKFALAGSFVVLVALTIWGGATEMGLKFFLGVAVVLFMLLGFVLLLRFLLQGNLKPVSSSARTSSSLQAAALGATLAVCSALLFTLSATWDEAWHRRFGGFGNDFLWPPHLLLYGSFGLASLSAAGALLMVFLKNDSSVVTKNWRAQILLKLRSEPLLTLLMLMAAYMMLSAPSDLLWHQLYGRDITAWSLPHLLLVTGVCGFALTGVTLALSLDRLSLEKPSLETSSTKSSQNLASTWLVLMALSFVLSFLLQVGVTEWDGVRQPIGNGAFWARPEWLYPVVLLGIAGFVGGLATRVLPGFKLFKFGFVEMGAATMVGLLCLLMRFLVLNLFAVGMSARAHVLVFLLLFVFDVAAGFVAWLRPRKNLFDEFSWPHAFLVAVVGLLLLLPAIANFFVYPHVNAATVPGMVLAGLLSGPAAIWSGMRLARLLRDFSGNQSFNSETWDSDLGVKGLGRRVATWSLGGVAAVLVLVLVSVFVAKPPT